MWVVWRNRFFPYTNETEDIKTSGRRAKEREHYYIRLGSGQVLEVEREVYLCWYATDRLERYQAERDRKNGVCSLEGLSEITRIQHDGRCEELLASPDMGVEELAIRNMMEQRMRDAIKKLQPKDRQLVQALFYDEVSMRSYAREQGVTHRTIQKRRDKVLQCLKELLET